MLAYTKLQPCTGIWLSSASGNKVAPIGKNYIGFQIRDSPGKTHINNRQILACFTIIGLDFNHKIGMGIEYDKNGKLFLHQNGK